MRMLYSRGIVQKGFRTVALLALLLVVYLAFSSAVMAQAPPPEPPEDIGIETPPTDAGLGPCDTDMIVGVLNDDWNTLPEDLVKRSGNGGFEALIVTNCIPVTINWYITDRYGNITAGAEGRVDVRDKFDDVEWVFLGEIEYERHAADVYEGGELKARAGDPVLDHNGNAIPIDDATESVTAYRYTLEYKNDKELIGGEEVRPMVAEQDYSLIFQVTPFDGAPPNLIHEFTFEVIAKIGGQWWDKLLRVLTPTYWIDKAVTYVTEGGAQGIQAAMCIVTLRMMTPDQYEALDGYDSNGDGRITADDDRVINAADPTKPNANGNCKRPDMTPEEELEAIETAAYLEVNENRALAGLPPISPRDKNESYVRQVFDGRDMSDLEGAEGASVAYGLDHITLAPRIGLNLTGLSRPPMIGGGGITTFTGMLTGTPPELTYERAIVRLGWSAMMNVMVAFIVLIIAWSAFSQVIRSFVGNQRGMADWRELTPRLVLAILAAITSYWWCSLLVDVADGLSRYVAAAMRVTPADITLTLGQAVLAIIIKSGSGFLLSFVPLGGILALALKLMTNFLIMVLMIVYALMLLTMIGQFVLRIVMINLLIIISPLAMVAWALPETSGWGRRWVQMFGVTLATQAIQLICFAMSTWFIREATPVGIVFDTGSFPSALQALLPTQMIWALALGAMTAYLTTKIPSMLGAGGVYEGFQSIFAMAALSAVALTMGPGGGGKLMGFFGGGGGGGMGGIGGGGGVGANLPGGVRGVMAAVSGADSVTSGLMRGVVQGGRAFMNPVGSNTGTGVSQVAGRGAAQAMGRESAGSQQGGPGAVETSTGQGGEGPEGGTGVPIGGAPPPPPPSLGGTPGGTPGASAPGSSSQSRSSMMEERRTERRERISESLGENYVSNAQNNGVRAINENTVMENGQMRPATDSERSLIEEMGPKGFNSALDTAAMQVGSEMFRGFGGSSGASQAQAQGAVEAAGGRGQHVERAMPSEALDRYADAGQMRMAMGDGQFEHGKASNLRAISPDSVSENGVMRPTTDTERGLISGIGVGRFNAVMENPEVRSINPAYMRENGAERPTTQEERELIDRVGMPAFNRYMDARADSFSQQVAPEQPAPQQATFADSQRAIAHLGYEGYVNAGAGNVQTYGPYQVMDGGNTRMATPGERELIREIGPERFNNMFAPPRSSAGTPDDIAAEAEREARAGTGGMGELGKEAQRLEAAQGPSFGTRIRAFGLGATEGFRSQMFGDEGAVRRTVRDVNTGEVSAETADGMTARDVLGAEEYAESAGRSIKYEGTGSWAVEDGKFVTLNDGEREVRSAMGDDAQFAQTMRSDIRLGDSIDRETGVPWVIADQTEDNSGVRHATEGEAAAIRTVGTDRFAEVMGKSKEFHGDGMLVRDEGTRRMATEGETRLYDTLGERKFSDVMGRTTEDWGYVHQSQEPSVEQVLSQSGREVVDLGRRAQRGVSAASENIRERLSSQEPGNGGNTNPGGPGNRGPDLRSQK